MFNRIAIPFSLLALVGIGLMRANPQDAAMIDSYHERVEELIESIPVDVNGWVGQKVPLPESATNLLKPNALVARRFTHEQRGVAATLMIVQCRDTRDMAGHFPPRCYPANGWLTSDEEFEPSVTVSGYEMRRYGFNRVAGRVERELHVYNIFALPTGELTVSMREVRLLSADFDFRRYGAAQIQILIDGSVDEADHAWILDEMFAIVSPSIEGVRASGIDQDPQEGSSS